MLLSSFQFLEFLSSSSSALSFLLSSRAVDNQASGTGRRETGKARTNMGSAAREREGASERGGRTCLESTGERVPRGRCLPPITPAPDPRRGAMMQQSQKQNISKAENQPSRLVLLSSANGDASCVPMPAWKRGYVSFKRKVGLVCVSWPDRSISSNLSTRWKGRR